MTLVIFSDEQKTHSELIEEATFMLTRTLKNTTLRNPHDYDAILDAVVDMYEMEVGSSAKGISGKHLNVQKKRGRNWWEWTKADQTSTTLSARKTSIQSQSHVVRESEKAPLFRSSIASYSSASLSKSR